MKIKTILKLFCKACPAHPCNIKPDCYHFDDFKKLLEEHEAKKKPKITTCPNCLYVFDLKDPYKKPDHLPTKNEGFEIKEEKESEKLYPPNLKILVQLEIEYNKLPEFMSDYANIIEKIKTYFENDIIIPETKKLKFKHLDKVKIAKIIQ